MHSERIYCYPDNNASCPKLVKQTEISAILYLSAGILIVLTVFGNLFVIITVSHFRQLHTPTNLFVLSLAVADFLNGFLIMPAQFSGRIEYCWYFGDAFCTYYQTYFYFLLFVSVLNLVSISSDRYIAVCNPFFYSRYVTKSVAGVCIIFIWFLAFLYTYAFIFHTGGYVVTDWCVGVCKFWHYYDWWMIHYTLTFLLPMLLIICLYSVIFVTARRHVKAINCMMKETKSADSKKTQLSKSSERKAAKTLGIVVLAFIVLCSPAFLFILVQMSFTIDLVDLAAVHLALTYLSTLNCCIDPIIYALFYPWFRKALKMMVTFEIFKSSSPMTNLFSD
ncbi:trace amine-associated receptor 6-like [Erpetoichthys calabaricus]|uniref:trace amine-associated receptor 6-like n=1 Tax=Erpetoichthys calabaricus TaxID=27687 RepID=UPI0022344846|nr:trace amine-associated receptor 6-like [Erpetoichthys calabaricus]